MLTSKVSRVEELDEAERRCWDSMCRSQERYRSAFYSRPFALAVSSCCPHVRVFSIRDARGPVAFLPVQFSSVRYRLLASAERVGLHLSDYFGLIADPGFRVSPEELLRLTGLSRLDFSHLDEHQTDLGLSGSKEGYGVVYDVSDGPRDYWQFVRERDKKFLPHTLRQLRRIERDIGPLRLELDRRDDEAALDSLMCQKRTQYRATGAKDALKAQWTRDCLKRLYATREPECSGVLSVLYAGDTPVSSHFGLRCRDTLHIWFPVYRPEFSKYSPGRLLLKALIDESIDHGLRRLDDGEAHDDQQQKRMMCNRRHLYFGGFWARPSLRGTIVSVDRAVSWRVAKRKARPNS